MHQSYRPAKSSQESEKRIFLDINALNLAINGQVDTGSVSCGSGSWGKVAQVLGGSSQTDEPVRTAVSRS
jgi:hypothetical protein